MNEREAFEAWLLGSYGKVYSKEDCDDIESLGQIVEAVERHHGIKE